MRGAGDRMPGSRRAGRPRSRPVGSSQSRASDCRRRATPVLLAATGTCHHCSVADPLAKQSDAELGADANVYLGGPGGWGGGVTLGGSPIGDGAGHGSYWQGGVGLGGGQHSSISLRSFARRS